jgi:hypothetical protein
MPENNSLPEPDPYEEEVYAALVARQIFSIPLQKIIAELEAMDRQYNANDE